MPCQSGTGSICLARWLRKGCCLTRSRWYGTSRVASSTARPSGPIARCIAHGWFQNVLRPLAYGAFSVRFGGGCACYILCCESLGLPCSRQASRVAASMFGWSNVHPLFLPPVPPLPVVCARYRTVSHTFWRRFPRTAVTSTSSRRLWATSPGKSPSMRRSWRRTGANPVSRWRTETSSRVTIVDGLTCEVPSPSDRSNEAR